MSSCLKQHLFKTSWPFFKWGEYSQRPVCCSWSDLQPPRLCARRSCRDPAACVVQLRLPETFLGSLQGSLWHSCEPQGFLDLCSPTGRETRCPLQARTHLDFSLQVFLKDQFLPLYLQQLRSRRWAVGGLGILGHYSLYYGKTSQLSVPNQLFASHSTWDIFPNLSQPQFPHLWLEDNNYHSSSS